MKLSIVLPIYNEAKILEKTVKKVKNTLEKLDYNYELIIAEDGSTDGSDKIATKLVSRDKRIRFLHSSKKLGRGKALKNALSNAKGDIFLYFDADLATDLSCLNDLIKRVEEGADISIGSRLLSSSKTDRSVLREMTSRGFNLFSTFLFNSKITDLQCGFKAFHKRTQPLLLQTRDSHWFWDTETLLKAERSGFKISQIPVRWKGGKKSKVKVIEDMLDMGLKLMKLRMEFLSSNKT